MRIKSEHEVPRCDLDVLRRLFPAIRSEWNGLQFDSRGWLQDPDTGERSGVLRLTDGTHRATGASYALTPPGSERGYRFTVATDDCRTLRGTLTGPAWSVDLELGARWHATGRVDVRTVLRSNDVPGPVIGLIGGGAGHAEVLVDPSALDRRGDLVTGNGRAQRAAADGVAHVVTKSAGWDCRLALQLHGRGLLGRGAFLVGRPAVRRAVRQGLDEFWSDLTSEAASWRSDLARLEAEMTAAGGPEALVHRELWRALREAEAPQPSS